MQAIVGVVRESVGWDVVGERAWRNTQRDTCTTNTQLARPLPHSISGYVWYA